MIRERTSYVGSAFRPPRRSPVKPSLVVSCAAAILVLAATADRAPAQQPPRRTAGGCPIDPVKFNECALPKTKTFNPPRTPDGRPDMQGYWERAFTSQDIEEHASGFG